MTHTRATLLKLITDYERETQKWEQRGKRIEKRFKDERPEAQANARRYNVLWSNTETLKPFLYSATPKPVVSQRGDKTDPVARAAAQVLERALVFTMAEDHFGSSLRNARDDYLLPGRGTVWARYVPEFKPAEAQVSESNADDQPTPSDATAPIGNTTEVVAFESAVVDYVNWKDFGHDLARTWEEVDVVWRKVALNRAAMTKRFEKGGKVPLDAKPEATGQAKEADADKAVVYELWIKSEKRAVWLSKSFNELLDDLPDPLKLDHFFPCPRPAYATLTTDSLIPVPDYAEYQDQADELDDLTGRIALLTKAIKAVGVYDASVEALKRILDDGHDNQMIPVKNWAGLAEKGGLKGAVEFLPMKEIAATLLSLYEAREKVKADLYEVSGMSDIIRGNTDPRETATAQRGKMNFATKRLEERQREVERFARNAVDLLGNIIAVHFSPETLVAMTGIKLLPNPQTKAIIQQAVDAQQRAQQAQQPAPNIHPVIAKLLAAPGAQAALSKPTWDEVIALLRDQPRRRFSIDIETDSMVAADDAEQQQQRTQFITATTSFIQEAGALVQAQPAVAPLMGQLLLFGVRGFRIGRDLDEAFEDFVAKAEALAAQPKPPQPDPKMAAVQAGAQADQQRLQMEDQQHQRELQADAQRHAADLQHEAQLEAIRGHFAQQQEAQQAALQAHTAQQSQAMEMLFDRFKALLDARTKIEVAEIAAGATLDAAGMTAANQAATQNPDGE